jgi:hypothetical protein
MSEPKIVNLAATVALDTYDLAMLFPGTNKPTGWVVTLAGPGHPKTVALAAEAERERLHRNAAIERAQVNGRKWKGDEEEDPTVSRRKTIAAIVGRIVDWTPVDFGQGPIAYSEEAAIALFLDPAKGVYFSQIVEYLTCEKAFMPSSAES